MESAVEHQYFSDAEEPDTQYEPASIKAESVASVKKDTEQQQGATAGGAKKRYIAFVGNLPFNAEKADLEGLFKDLEVRSIRMITDRVTGKSKGIAFVEFADAGNLMKAVELHLSKVKGRKVNVELTVGGGGHKENRKGRIQAKNEKFRREKAGVPSGRGGHGGAIRRGGRRDQQDV